MQKVKRFELAPGVRIGHGNVFRGLTLVRLGRGATIRRFNWITGDSGRLHENPEQHMQLQMGAHSHILSRHFLDCGGGVIMDDDVWITGIHTTIFSHGVDPVNGGIMLEPVRIERGAMVAMRSTILPGTTVGTGSFIAAGSVTWSKQVLAEGCLYGGSPARRLSPIQISDWCYQHNRYPDD